MTSPSPKLSLSDLAFIIADIATGPTRINKASWHDLGDAAEYIKKEIAAQNIDLEEPEVVCDIYLIAYEDHKTMLVDLNYGGGGTGPDPFRFVYFVIDGQYAGYAGEVAS